MIPFRRGVVPIQAGLPVLLCLPTQGCNQAGMFFSLAGFK